MNESPENPTRFSWIRFVRDFVRDIDALLRGSYTSKEQLQAGTVDVPVRTLAQAALVLGAVYGVMMGLFAVFTSGLGGLLQLVATTIKVPLLFMLTLVVTFPSLYVFSALARSRLKALSTFRLVLAALTLNLAVLASFGPVTAFFTLSTTSYPFMVLLNVFFFGVAGLVGLVFLRQALNVVFEPLPAPETAGADA